MSRSIWKGFFVDLNLVKKFDDILAQALEEFRITNNYKDLTDVVIKANRLVIISIARKLSYEEPIELWTRRSTVLPEFVGFCFSVYNGKSFHVVKVNSNMLFHKFGEFVFTKRLGTKIHFNKKNKSKESVKKKR